MAEYFEMRFASDDSLVEEESNGEGEPVSFTLNIDEEEKDEIELYVEAKDGYKINDMDIDFSGNTSDRWKIKEIEGTYGDSINFSEVDDDGGQNFKVQAEATAEDTVEIDETVTIDAEGTAEATE